MKVGAYRMEAPCPDLLAMMDRAHEEDKSAESKAGKFGCAAIAAGALGLFGAPVVFGALLQNEDAIPGGMLVGLGIAAVLGVLAWLNKRHDLDDRKVDLLRRVLGVLRVDVPPQQPVSLQVDFGMHTQGKYKTGVQGGFMGFGLRTEEYSHPWLDLTTRLYDRSVVRIQAIRNAKRKIKPKRKYTKVNELLQDVVVLRVKVPAGTDVSAVPGRLQGTRMPGSLGLVDCRVRGSEVQVKLRSGQARRTTGRGGACMENGMDDLATADSILATLVWLFRGLRAGETGSASA